MTRTQRSKLAILPVLLSACAGLHQGPATPAPYNPQQTSVVDKETATVDARVNSMQRVERDLNGVSTQGAHAIGYFEDGTLRKATVEQYGESYKASSRFYFSNSGAVIFVADTEERYDRSFDTPGARVDRRIERVYYYEAGYTSLVREDGVDVEQVRSEKLAASTSAYAAELSKQLTMEISHAAASPAVAPARLMGEHAKTAIFTYDRAGDDLVMRRLAESGGTR